MENEEQMGNTSPHPPLLAEVMTGQPQAPTKSLEMGLLVTWLMFSQTHQNLSIQMIAVPKGITLKGIIIVLLKIT